jgi:hypothetical protein
MSRLWVQLLRVRVVSGEAAPLELHARVPLLRRLGCLLDVRLLQLLLLLLLLLHLQQGVQRLCSARYRIRLPPAGHQRAWPSTRHPSLPRPRVPQSRRWPHASRTMHDAVRTSAARVVCSPQVTGRRVTLGRTQHA